MALIAKRVIRFNLNTSMVRGLNRLAPIESRHRPRNEIRSVDEAGDDTCDSGSTVPPVALLQRKESGRRCSRPPVDTAESVLLKSSARVPENRDFRTACKPAGRGRRGDYAPLLLSGCGCRSRC